MKNQPPRKLIFFSIKVISANGTQWNHLKVSIPAGLKFMFPVSSFEFYGLPDIDCIFILEDEGV
ncbi:hypothetical protein B9Y60_10645 [Stenotrophomonas maltophilia]|nr:hypothetical protein B9Y73_10645 [Stenotrophomonas maltophilia]PJL55134.1 hypothetical protein B9Y60_10645 [Stenotrophomonas maltophilia]